MIKSMKNAFDLTGKNAIVTGGNGGIGKHISLALAEQGANVAIFCRNQEKAKKALEELSAFGGVYKSYYCDVGDPDNCKEACAKVIEDYGKIDVLVNNSGIGCGGEILSMSDDFKMWLDVQNIDLNGTLFMSYFIGKHMRDNGYGKVINISSNSGDMVNKPQRMSPYNVAKAGVNMLTKCLAFEWGEYGIRVNAIAPGFTMAGFADNMPQAAIDEMTAKIPVGRFGEGIEIGALAVYLASEASDQMTGAILTIDGGYCLAN